jgi:quinol monooxygenase YgiN
MDTISHPWRIPPGDISFGGYQHPYVRPIDATACRAAGRTSDRPRSAREEYKAALREGIETAIRLEPGVLTLYAVSVKNDPAQIRIFEMYADAAAYQAHLQTPHFKKYKTGTQGMVKSLVLVETEPILLGAKAK